MIAIREIVEVKNGIINFKLPNYILTDKVEIIIIPYKPKELEKDLNIDFSKYFGLSDVGTDKIDNYLKNARDEWGQGFSY